MSNYGGKKSWKSTELDEVEELLRAAEDSMMLKLNVNTHHTSRSSSSSFTTFSSSSALEDDLVRRFEALKKPSVSNKITTVPSRSGEKKEGSGDDVFARFSALKGGAGSSVEQGSEVVEQEEEDEVSKLIQWAVDAARLDPSLGDDEVEEIDSDDDEDSSSDDDEDEEEEDVRQKQSKKKKNKEKPKK